MNCNDLYGLHVAFFLSLSIRTIHTLLQVPYIPPVQYAGNLFDAHDEMEFEFQIENMVIKISHTFILPTKETTTTTGMMILNSEGVLVVLLSILFTHILHQKFMKKLHNCLVFSDFALDSCFIVISIWTSGSLLRVSSFLRLSLSACTDLERPSRVLLLVVSYNFSLHCTLLLLNQIYNNDHVGTLLWIV